MYVLSSLIEKIPLISPFSIDCSCQLLFGVFRALAMFHGKVKLLGRAKVYRLIFAAVDQHSLVPVCGLFGGPRRARASGVSAHL